VEAPPESNDNHWLDGIVGCAVAGSMSGAVLPGTDTPRIASRAKIPFPNFKRKKIEKSSKSYDEMHISRECTGQKTSGEKDMNEDTEKLKAKGDAPRPPKLTDRKSNSMN
jgi:hypothetical protein